MSITDHFTARKIVAQFEKQGFDQILFEVGENTLCQEKEWSWLETAHLNHPPIFKDRGGQQMVAIALIPNQNLAELNNIWHIQIEPNDSAIVDALESGIESTADVDYDSIRMERQKLTDIPVKFSQAHNDGDLIMAMHFEM
jgi:hypothetical protein